jgi:hypothetical protein
MTQVNNDLTELLKNQVVLLVIGLVILLVIGGVILPAVWSSKRTRRIAALAVLDRLLRWKR